MMFLPSSRTIPEILFPSMAWRVGRPNYKVRKAAVVDMIHIFQNELITPEIAVKYFSDFLSNFKTALDDDRDGELRYLCIQLVKLYLIPMFLFSIIIILSNVFPETFQSEGNSKNRLYTYS